MIYPSQIKAARALIGMNQLELAKLVGVSPATIKRIEGSGDELRFKVDTMLRIQEALESHGITFIDADEIGGVGVRLKQPRSRQLRLSV
jgi:transcriptional regulator with XRE-family HTH domain